MIDGAHAGLLIALYYASAGALVFAGLHGAILAPSSPHVRSAWFYVAATLQVALFQVLCARQYTAPDLTAAIAAHKWLNAVSLSIFPPLLAALVFLAPSRRLIRSIWAMTALCAALAAVNFIMPYGLRFTDVARTRLLVLPWDERLFFVDGPSAITRYGVEILSFLVVLTGALQMRKVLGHGEGLSARLVGLGTALMLFSLCMTILAHDGGMALPYVGGFSYLIFVFGLGWLVDQQISEARAGRQRVLDRLIAEIGNHGETHARMVDQLHHDTLTTLVNRIGMHDRLRDALEDCRRRGRQLQLLQIDIDRFGQVNDSFGHAVGDQVLAQVAARLHEQVWDGGFVARIDGDQFIVAATDLGIAGNVGLFFDKEPKHASLSIAAGGHKIDLSFSIGVATYPGDGETVPDLLAAADLALRDAKKQGRGQMRFFRRDLSEEIHQRLRLGNALKEALGKGELELFFQPQIDALDGRPVSMEALIRWRHPAEGLISPDDFIPLAEEMHLIVAIGGWVIGEACRCLAQWRRKGVPDVRIAVNLSAQQLQHKNLLHLVQHHLAQNGLTGGDLELEITESVLMAEPEKAVVQLEKLRDLGVRLSIDDFGTGYSSLSYLNILPIDSLKLDRSFVSDIGGDGKGAAICAATISLAASLGISTVAEGVEREAQAEFLRDQGCEVLQGYLFSKPLPPDEAAGFLMAAASSRAASPA